LPMLGKIYDRNFTVRKWNTLSCQVQKFGQWLAKLI
jgi:hypothetical protein